MWSSEIETQDEPPPNWVQIKMRALFPSNRKCATTNIRCTQLMKSLKTMQHEHVTCITIYKLHFEFSKVSKALARASHLRTPMQFSFHAFYLNIHVITPRYKLLRVEWANFSDVNATRRNMWVIDITRTHSKSPGGYHIIEYSRLRRHITMETVDRMLPRFGRFCWISELVNLVHVHSSIDFTLNKSWIG